MGMDCTTIASKASTDLWFAGHTHRLDLEGPGNSEQGCRARGALNQHWDRALHYTISRTREREMCQIICRDLQASTTIYGKSGSLW